MSVCFISGSWPSAACGIGDSLPPLLQKLVEDLDDVHVITTKNYNNKFSDEIIIHDIIEKWSVGAYKLVLNKLTEIRAKLVHIQYSPKEYRKNPFINFLPYLLRNKNYKVMVTIHEYSDNSLLGKIRLWPTIIWADHIFVPDHQFVADIKKIFKNKSVDFIQQAPNIPRSSLSKTEKEDLKNQFLSGGFNLLLGFFGLVDKNKKLLPVIHAIRKLKDEHNINAKFLIIGKPVETDIAVKKLRNKIKQLNLSKNCSFTGYTDKIKVADYLSVLDYAIQFYKNGISPRHASFLAAVNQNIKVITESSKNYKPDYQNIYYLENDKNISEEICKIIIENLNVNLDGNQTDFSGRILNEAKEKHLSVYNNLLRKHSG